MPTTLFNYSIEENENKLVITVGGTLAEEALRSLRETPGAGAAFGLQTLLSPLIPISKLLSASVGLAGAEGTVQDWSGGAGGGAPEEDYLSQTIDQTYEAFQQQIREIQQSIESLGAEKQPSKKSQA